MVSVLSSLRVLFLCSLAGLVPATAPAIASAAQLTGGTAARDPAIVWQRAIAADDTEVLASMLAEHPRAGLVETTASNGKTALMVAAKAADLDLARDLVASGAQIDAVTVTGGTAMMFAALGERVDVALWLHEHGARTDAVGSNGWTAVTIAAARGFAPMLQWLLSVDAPAASIDVYGYTPLMRAVENGHEDTTAILLEAGAESLDHQDEFGNTALHHAARSNRDDLVALLLAAGANETITNRDGQGPYGSD